MVQFKIVSGKLAGVAKTARHFPFQIGRAAAADLRLEDEGVWDRHLELTVDRAEGFILTTHPNALAALNGLPFRRAVLRNGDTIDIGALKIRFWLGATRQSGLRFWESLTWLACLFVFVAQLALIYRLVR